MSNALFFSISRHAYVPDISQLKYAYFNVSYIISFLFHPIQLCFTELSLICCFRFYGAPPDVSATLYIDSYRLALLELNGSKISDISVFLRIRVAKLLYSDFTCYDLNRITTKCYELVHNASTWAELRVGISCFYDKG